MLLLGCGKEEREIRGWVGNPLQRVGLLNGFEVGEEEEEETSAADQVVRN